jgi:hypothetical protein
VPASEKSRVFRGRAMHKPKNQAPDILAAKALASLEINLGICIFFLCD